MITIRPAIERGHANYGWLDTYYSFSFADYYDPQHMGFRDLRVINEDKVEGGQGFGTHPHRDMEIITYVMEGAVEHQDSMGKRTTIRPGEFQRITAGTGITHSEINPSPVERLHLLQIWLLPERQGLTPGYEEKSPDLASSGLHLVASGNPTDKAMKIHQDVHLYVGRLKGGEDTQYTLQPGRHAWIQVTRGSITANGIRIAPGDGAAISDETHLDVRAQSDTEFLLFDLN